MSHRASGPKHDTGVSVASNITPVGAPKKSNKESYTPGFLKFRLSLALAPECTILMFRVFVKARNLSLAFCKSDRRFPLPARATKTAQNSGVWTL